MQDELLKNLVTEACTLCSTGRYFGIYKHGTGLRIYFMKRSMGEESTLARIDRRTL
jgi:hypothetical protein